MPWYGWAAVGYAVLAVPCWLLGYALCKVASKPTPPCRPGLRLVPPPNPPHYSKRGPGD